MRVPGKTEDRREDTVPLVELAELHRLTPDQADQFFAPFRLLRLPELTANLEPSYFKRVPEGEDPTRIDRAGRSSVHTIVAGRAAAVSTLSMGQILDAGGVDFVQSISAQPRDHSLAPISKPVEVRGTTAQQFVAGWRDTRTKMCVLGWNDAVADGRFRVSILRGPAAWCESGRLVAIADAMTEA